MSVTGSLAMGDLILLSVMYVYTTAEGKTTCTTSLNHGDQSATITCHFDDDLSKTKDDFMVLRYPAEEVVARSHWRSGTGHRTCIFQKGYSCTCKVDHTTRLRIVRLTEAYTGTYVCRQIPDRASDVASCRVSLNESIRWSTVTQTNRWLNSAAGDTARSHGLSKMAVAVLVGLPVLFAAAFLIFRLKRRAGQKQLHCEYQRGCNKLPIFIRRRTNTHGSSLRRTEECDDDDDDDDDETLFINGKSCNRKGSKI